jgi:hypothetical protein
MENWESSSVICRQTWRLVLNLFLRTILLIHPFVLKNRHADSHFIRAGLWLATFAVLCRVTIADMTPPARFGLDGDGGIKRDMA